MQALDIILRIKSIVRRSTVLLAMLPLAGCVVASSGDVSDVTLAKLRSQGVSASVEQSIKQRAEKALSSTESKRKIKRHAELQNRAVEQSVSLEDLLKSTLERNTTIASAANNIDRSSAQHMNAILGYLPQISAAYTYEYLDERVLSSDNAVYQLGEAQYPVKTGSFTIEQPLWDLSRIYAIKYAHTTSRKSEVDYLAAIAEASHKVFGTYLMAVQSKLRMQSLQKRQHFINRQITGQAVLDTNGMGDEGSLAALRGNKADLHAEETLEAATFEQSITELARLSGTVVSDVQDIKFPKGFEGIEDGLDLEEAVADALSHNPRMLSSALQVTAAEQRYRQALASDFSPVVSSYLTFEDEERTASRFGGGSHTQDTTLGFKLSIPIFNASGAGYSNAVMVQDADSAAIDHHALARELETQLRATYARMRALTKSLRSLNQVVVQNGRAYRNERNKLTNGQSVDLAVAARELSLNKAIERRNYYQIEYLKSWGQLQYLLGKNLLDPEF
nr:TolC family protein [uncultured Cohaesibacter sp.]